jgi:hypothetical protein
MSKTDWLRAGIFGAIANIAISGSTLFCLFLFVSFGSASAVPGIWSVFVMPLLLIGFAAGSISSLMRFGKPMTVFAAVLGSVAGLLASLLVTDHLERIAQPSYEGFPVFRHSGWILLAVTSAGIAQVIITMSIASLIRRVTNRFV